MAMLVVLDLPLVILVLTAISVLYSFGTSAIFECRSARIPQICTRLLPRWLTTARLSMDLAENAWYNRHWASMLLGGFMMILPMLAIAGIWRGETDSGNSGHVSR